MAYHEQYPRQCTGAASCPAITGGFLPPIAINPCESTHKTLAAEQPTMLCAHGKADAESCMPGRGHSRPSSGKDVLLPKAPPPKKEEISSFPSSPRKPLKWKACSHSPWLPQLSAWDHLQQYRVPAALDLLHMRQLVHPRDSSIQMTFPSHDK